MGLFNGWTPEAIVALAVAVAGGLAWPAKTVIQWLKSSSSQETETSRQGWSRYLEAEAKVENLRVLLDRGRRRENAYATACELLLIVMPPEPTHEQLATVERARELFETALVLRSGSEGGG